MIPFGDIFNLTTLRANLRHPVLEWADVKKIPPNSSIEIQLEPTDPALEHFGCWSTNRRSAAGPTWVEGAENILRIDMSFTRVPDWAYMNASNKAEVHTTFPGLSSIIWPKHPNPGTRNLPLLRKSRFNQTLPPDQQLACFDFMFFISSGVKPFEFEQRWSPAWNTVGTNMRFTQSLIDMAGVYLRRAMHLDEGSPFPAVRPLPPVRSNVSRTHGKRRVDDHGSYPPQRLEDQVSRRTAASMLHPGRSLPTRSEQRSTKTPRDAR